MAQNLIEFLAVACISVGGSMILTLLSLIIYSLIKNAMHKKIIKEDREWQEWRLAEQAKHSIGAAEDWEILAYTDIVLSHFKNGSYKSVRTLVNETCLEADIVEKALKVLLENNEIAIENPEAGINKLYYQKPKTKWRQKK